jgi:hypothetical protein
VVSVRSSNSRDKFLKAPQVKVFSGISSINNLSQGSGNTTSIEYANTNNTFDTRVSLKDKGFPVIA